MIVKSFYKIKLEMLSPISIGQTNNESTDHDIIRDYSQKPFLPGTSICGSLIHSLTEEERTYIGVSSQKDLCKSSLFVSNGSFVESPLVKVRNGVQLEDRKTVDKSKYDYEIVEQFYLSQQRKYEKQQITFQMELNTPTTYSKEIVNKMVSNINSGVVRFGYKTTRGLGWCKVISMECFDLSNETCNDYFNCKEKYSKVSLNEDKLKSIERSFVIENGIMIREYSDQMDGPDYLMSSLGGYACIPGSSFNGALKEMLKKLDFSDEQINNVFGFSIKEGKKTNKVKSKVFVEDILLEGGKFLNATRNCIDRVSGSTKDGALFTENVYVGGHGKIILHYIEESISNEEITMIQKALDAILMGAISVGGQAGIGRGILIGED